MLQMNRRRAKIGGPAHGKPIPGFTLADCDEQFGDTIDRVVSWKSRVDVSGLAGKPVRLRFELKDADVFAFQFTKDKPSP